jgi:hypothetical protein
MTVTTMSLLTFIVHTGPLVEQETVQETDRMNYVYK